MPYSFCCSFYTKSTETLNSHPASPVLALLSHAHQREFLTIRLAHLTKWAARACHFQKIWQQDWRWGPQRIQMGYSHFCELEMHSSNGNWWNCVGYQEPASFFPEAVDNEAQSASGAVPKINCCSWEAHFTLESDRQCASKVAKTKHLNKRISLGFQKKTNNLQPQKITWLRISEPSPILWRIHSQKSGPQLECPAAFRAALEALVPSHSHDAHWLASGWLPRSSWIEIDAFTSSKPNRPAKPLIASWMPGTDVLDFQVWQNSNNNNNNNNNNATGWVENHQFENTCPLEGAKVSATPTQSGSAGPNLYRPTMKVHYITGLPTRWISLGISFSMRVLFTLFLLGDLPAFSPEFPATPEILRPMWPMWPIGPCAKKRTWQYGITWQI